MMTVTSLLVAVLMAPQQDMSAYAPPAELKHVSYMVGNWKCSGTAMGMDGSPSKMSGTAKVSLSLDRYIEWNTDDNIEGMGPIKGKFMLSYDSMSKKWQGTWFDTMSSLPLNLSGQMKGNVLTMMSGEMPDMMGGKTVYRVTYTKKSANNIEMKVDFKMNGQFMNAMTNNYTR